MNEDKAAGQAGLAIYQVQQYDGDWHDCPKDFYDTMKPEDRRIVYATPADAGAGLTERELNSLLLAADHLSRYDHTFLANLLRGIVARLSTSGAPVTASVRELLANAEKALDVAHSYVNDGGGPVDDIEAASNAIARFLLAPAPVTAEPAQSIHENEEVRQAVADGLRGLWGCGRVWSAWYVGTMSEEDFYAADESDECIDQMIHAIAFLITAPAPADRDAIRDQALTDARAAVRELQDNLETFGPYGEESARVALDGALDAIDDLKSSATTSEEAAPAPQLAKTQQQEKAAPPFAAPASQHEAGDSVLIHNKQFTPMETRGTLVYLGRAGGFDVRDCPEPEALAQFIAAACNYAATRCRAEGGATINKAENLATPSPAKVDLSGQWVSVDDERKPEAGVTVLLYVRTLKHGLDDDLRPFHTEDAQVEMGEYRKGASVEMSYFDCYASPISDNDWITHWMPLPTPPGVQALIGTSTSSEDSAADEQKGGA